MIPAIFLLSSANCDFTSEDGSLLGSISGDEMSSSQKLRVKTLG